MLLQHRLFVCSLILGKMLSESCPVCLVCDVGVLWPNGRMDQDETWMLVGLDPGHFALDGDAAPPPQRGTSPNFGPYLLWSNCCKARGYVAYVFYFFKDTHV